MERHEQVTQAILDGISEVNSRLRLKQPLERSPDTILIGESSTLDSLGVLTLFTLIQENIEKTFSQSLDLLELVWSAEPQEWSVRVLAARVAEMLESAALN